MMTSATLIEALYEAVSDWLSENANGKTNIMELSSADPWHIYNILKLFTHHKLQHPIDGRDTYTLKIKTCFHLVYPS